MAVSVMWPQQQFPPHLLEELMRILKKLSGKGCDSMKPVQTMSLWAVIHPFLIGWGLHHPSTGETWKTDFHTSR